jgi:hypothetical protein
MQGMQGGAAHDPGFKTLSAADFMGGNRDGNRPPEPPIQPLEPDMQEITQQVFADKVDDLVALFASAAGSRQGLKLLQNVLGGVVGAGGKQLATMLTKHPEQIVKILEEDPNRLEQLVHHLSESNAGAKLTALLQKDPDGVALFAQIQSDLDDALSEYNDEVATFEEEFAQYQTDFDTFQSQMMANMQQGNQGGNQGGMQGGNFGGPQGGMQGGNFGGQPGGFDPNQQGGNFGGPQGGMQGGPQGGNFGGQPGGFINPPADDQDAPDAPPVDAPDAPPVDAPDAPPAPPA